MADILILITKITMLLTIFIYIISLLIKIKFIEKDVQQDLITKLNYTIAISTLILFILLIIKLLIKIKLTSIHGFTVTKDKLGDKLQHISGDFWLYFDIYYTNYISDAILILSVFCAYTSMFLLNSNTNKMITLKLPMFTVYFFLTLMLVNSKNILIIFLSFEMMFIPTVFFALKLGYSKDIDKATKYLFLWTIFGAFLIFIGVVQMYTTYNTLNIHTLQTIKKTNKDLFNVFIFIILGFCVKLPIYPFSYWLTKVHVETSAGFSMYLSGFLVKTALYCIYIFLQIADSSEINSAIKILTMLSMLISTIALLIQLDIKRFVAYATVQEMNLILFTIISKNLIIDNICTTFIIMHGILSCLMFFTVDLIQKRTNTRIVTKISGLSHVFPRLTKIIWFVFIVFAAYPFSIKFYLELDILILLMNDCFYIQAIYIVVIITISSIASAKLLFNLLYGNPKEEYFDTVDVTKLELNFIYTLAIMLLFGLSFLLI